MLCSTIRDILTKTEAKYGAEDAVRYKVKKNETASRTYTELREDSESFSAALKELGQQGNHIAVIGRTSYEWLVSYFGIVDGGSVAVPLDASLPAEDLCELLDRADVTALVFDPLRTDVAEMAESRLPQTAIPDLHAGGGRDRTDLILPQAAGKNTGGASIMPRSRTSSAPFCLPPGPPARARASC